MTQLLDPYLVRARLFPALIAIIPAIALGLTLVPWTSIDFTHAFLALGISLLIYASTTFTRDLGKALEPGIFERMGGKPSTVMLRHSDHTIGDVTKARYVKFLAAQIDAKAPTADDEKQDPKAADSFYDACANWLRIRVNADKNRFPRLFDELVAYGFHRNLLGIRPLGFALNLVVIAVSGAAAYFNFRSHDYQVFSLILLVSILHAAYFLFVVSERRVQAAARTYARQLLESTELFIDQPKSS